MTDRERRARRMGELALMLMEREAREAEREGILQAPDMASVFALASAMVVVRMKEVSDEVASEVSASAVRTFLANLQAHNIELGTL